MLITFTTGLLGLAPGFTVLNADNSVYAARSTSVLDLGGGIYGATVDDAVLAGRTVLWDTGAGDTQYAAESFPAAQDLARVGSYYNLVMSQPGTTQALAGSTLEVVQNDVPYALAILMTDASGVPISLTNKTVRVIVPGLGVSANATNVTPQTGGNIGRATFTWLAAHFQTAGTFEGEIQLTDGSNVVTTYKTFTVRVRPELG